MTTDGPLRAALAAAWERWRPGEAPPPPAAEEIAAWCEWEERVCVLAEASGRERGDAEARVTAELGYRPARSCAAWLDGRPNAPKNISGA